MATEHNTPNINMEKMWEDYTNEGIGVQGYNVPKIQINCAKEKKDKENFEFMEKVWKGKQLYPKAKENYDKDGKLIPVKRPNYFDNLFKSINFGYSKAKENELKELYERKNRPMSIDPNKLVIIKDKNKAKYYKHDRITYFESLIKDMKKNREIHPHMESIIEKVKDDLKKSPKKPTESEAIRNSYKKRGSLP